MSSHGLIIRNSKSEIICNSDNPTMGLHSTVATQYSGNAITYGGVSSQGMLASTPLLLENYPVGAVPCYDYTAYHYSATNGIGFIVNNGTSQPCSIIQPISTFSPVSGVYGVEVYNAAGSLTWSTNYKQFVLREVIPVAASTIKTQLSTMSTTPTRISYTPCNNPVFILSGFTAYRPDFGSDGYTYSVAGVRKIAVKSVGPGALDMLWTWVFYGSSGGSAWAQMYYYYRDVLSTIPAVSTTQYIIVGELL